LRVLWALHELGVEYGHRRIGSRTGETQTEEYTRLNPRQKIPVLVHGDLVLAESAAIISYLAGRFPNPALWLPEDGSTERGQHDQWAFFIMTELDAHTLYVLRKHEALSDIYGDAPNALRAAREGFNKQSGVVSRHLAEGGPYLLGDRFAPADILLGTCLDWAVNYGFDLTEPLDAYKARVNARPAYIEARAANYD
jgi:glutathione S-transferase